jgi:hypothetical protein
MTSSAALHNTLQKLSDRVKKIDDDLRTNYTAIGDTTILAARRKQLF